MPPNGPRCISGATGIGNTATWQNGEFPVPVGLVIRLKHRGALVVPMGVFVALGVLVAGGHQVGAIGEVYIAKYADVCAFGRFGLSHQKRYPPASDKPKYGDKVPHRSLFIPDD